MRATKNKRVERSDLFVLDISATHEQIRHIELH